MQTNTIPQSSFLGATGPIIIELILLWALIFAGLSGLFYAWYASRRKNQAKNLKLSTQSIQKAQS